MSKTRLAAVLALLIGSLWAGTSRPGAAQQSSGAAVGGSAQGEAKQGGTQQPVDSKAQPPTFRGGIDFIRVDVFVTDRNGKPVTDLEQADFELVEDGKPQAIEQFNVVKIDGTSPVNAEPPRRIRTADDEEVEARRDDVRMFVFFLDDYHVRDRNAVAIRDVLTRFIETQVRPADMLAVMYPLTPASEVRFTRDHENVITAIQRFEGYKYKYMPRNAVERELERQPTEIVEKVRNQIVYSALESLTYRLGGLRDGRKSVIFVSEGLTVMLPAQMRRADAAAPQPLVTGTPDPRVEEMAEIQAQMELDSRMRDIYKAANRNNTAFYPIDPRGLAVFEFDISDGGATVVDQSSDARSLRSTQETLRTLAVETGGRAIINRNTLGEGLAEMVRDSSFYYLLGYTTPAQPDGKFHEIRVRVKRSGVNVQARKGYWAYTPEDVKRILSPTPELSKPVQQALATLAMPGQATRFVRTWVGTERGDSGKTRVTLVWEPLPLQPNVRREQAGRVSLLAIDGQGGLVYRGRSPEGEPAAAAPAASPGSATGRGATAGGGVSGPQRIVFEAPPGRLDMKLQVEGVGGGTIDDETRTIDVPDLTSPQARLSTPKVFRSRNAREFQNLVADGSAVPVAVREFSRTERLLIRFDAYGPGSEKPVPTAALLSRTGQKLADLPVAATQAGGTHQIDLSLNTTSAGEYLIEIALTDSSGVEVKELVALRVGA